MEEIHSSSSKSKKKVSHQIYFVKFHPSFVDPALKEAIEKSNEFIKRTNKSREMISREISSIEVKMHKKRDEFMWQKRVGNFDVEYFMRRVGDLRRQLEIQWPEEDHDINLDLDSELVERIVEDFNIDEKIEELSNILKHGRRNLAEEKRVLRELKEMQRKKNQLDQTVKPTTFQRPRWNSKEGIQQRILVALKMARDVNKRERKLTEEYEAIKDETQKRIMSLKEKEADTNRKKTRANRRILKVKMQLNKQGAIYDEYMTHISNAKALAEKKDLAAVEDISYKQVEEFMSHWNNDESFRANYKRSIIPSLGDRKLTCDGRQLDEELWRKVP